MKLKLMLLIEIIIILSTLITGCTNKNIFITGGSTGEENCIKAHFRVQIDDFGYTITDSNTTTNDVALCQISDPDVSDQGYIINAIMNNDEIYLYVQLIGTTAPIYINCIVYDGECLNA